MVNAIMMRIARWMAILGGIVLFGVVVVTVLSVAGRMLDTIGHNDGLEAAMPGFAEFLQGFGPILGDFELVEAGVAIAIVAFFPWCAMMRNHATVDIFTSGLKPRTNAVIDAIWEVVFAVVMIVLAWRLFIGTWDKYRYGETSFLLQFPVWWGFAACAVLMAISAVVNVYMVFLRIGELRAYRPDSNAPGRAGH